MRGACVHDLRAGQRAAVQVGASGIASAEAMVTGAAARLRTVTGAAARQRGPDFTPSPEARCRTRDVRTVCKSAQR